MIEIDILSAPFSGSQQPSEVKSGSIKWILSELEDISDIADIDRPLTGTGTVLKDFGSG